MARVLALLMLIAAQAEAGAWPREKGKTFLSFSIEAEQPDAYGRVKTYSTLYVEHGLSKRLTLGLDAGGDRNRMSKAILFLRVPLLNPSRKTNLSAEIGAGRAADRTALRPGISLGRGFRWGKRYGWMALDTRFVLFDGAARWLIESDATLGLNATRKTKLILQVQSGFPDHARSYVKVAPSLVYEFRPGHHAELGVVAGVKELDSVALKFGLWRYF